MKQTIVYWIIAIPVSILFCLFWLAEALIESIDYLKEVVPRYVLYIGAIVLVVGISIIVYFLTY